MALKPGVPPEREKRLRPVSELFRYDWNFAISASRLPVLGPASSVLSLAPLYDDYLAPLIGASVNLRLFWLAAVLYIASFFIIRLFCPAFIRQYTRFSDFEGYGHSHRWIVWEFWSNLQDLYVWEDTVRETIGKQLASPASESNISPRELEAAFSESHQRTETNTLQFRFLRSCSQTSAAKMFGPDWLFKTIESDRMKYQNASIKIFTPYNVQRDIVLPFIFDAERYIIHVKEDDENKIEKQREMFWILFTSAAREGRRIRAFFWIFFYLSIALYAITIIINIFRGIL